MLLYHCTTAATVAEIQQNGFADAGDGVRFASIPLVPEDEHPDRVVLVLELVGQTAESLARYAWEDPDHRAAHREWIIPADFVNPRAVIVHVDLPPSSLTWVEQAA